MDGVEFLLDKMKNCCINYHNKFICNYEARDEGYYAVHLSVWNISEIPKLDWDTEKVNTCFEIQITTQLQEVIRALLHVYYEDKRKQLVKDNTIWQWNYKSDEFSANYLGHILHYIEGMIMEVRDKKEDL